MLKRFNNKKGFTLIELLSIIVAIALISVISIPVIVNVIEKSRRKAFEESVILTSKQLEKYMLKYDDYEKEDHDEVTVQQLKKITKNNFTNGKYIISNGQTEAYFITNGNYCALGTIKNLTIKKNCISLDESPAVIVSSKMLVSSTSKSITVTLQEGFATDIESGIKKYIISLKNTDKREELTDIGSVTFDGLTTGTYIVSVEVINRNDKSITEEKEISTKVIDTPEYIVSPNEWAQRKTVTIIYPEGYTNEYSTEGGAEGTWQTYTEPVEFNANGTIIARVNDGVNYVTSSSQTISEIDTSAPTAASVNLESTTSKSITVTASGTDRESNIYGYQFSKDNGSTWTDIQTSNEYTFNNLTTGTYSIKSKVINNTYGNNGINDDNSLESDANSISTNSISAPTYSTSPSSGWTQSKTVTIDYHDTNNEYTHEYSLEGGAEGTWQTYTEPLVFTANGTVLAKVTDGTNTVTGYISGSSYSVSEIDTTPPSANASIGTRTTTSIVVNATCSDDSNITKIEYQKDGGSWIDNGTTTSYTFSSLSQGTSYSFKIRCTNGVSLSTESSAEAGVTKATAVFDGNGGSNGTSITADVGAQLGTLPSSSRSYTITYNTNSSGGTSSKTSETVTYTHNGWWTAASGGSQISTTTTMPSGGATYYAHWTGGTTTLATITRTGYTCTWNTKSDGTGTSYASGTTSYAPTSTHTLYARCTINQYTATFNGNGGSNGTSITKNYGATLGTLPNSSRTGYVFAGWYTATSGGTQVTTSTTMPAGGATYYAQWVQIKNFAYTGNVQSYTVPRTGTYKLEVWGAQGGRVHDLTWGSSQYGGKGGYSYGNKYLTAGTTIYIVVGGAGSLKESLDSGTSSAIQSGSSGGYNGGGAGGKGTYSYELYYMGGAGGGGATHIATTNRGVLKNYSSYKGEILIVAGGGGGGSFNGGYGGTGGGASGGSSTKYNSASLQSSGGTQSAGYSFGQGQAGRNASPLESKANNSCEGGGGAGGGYYGGYASQTTNVEYSNAGGGGGSGYIGGVSSGATSNGSREGNGYATITFVG